jgi:broad specificity phosphatase PhoE
MVHTGSAFRHAFLFMLLTASVAYRRLSFTRQRFSTIFATTAIGEYTPVPYEDLLLGIVDRPVTVYRPTTLRNKYYGLRHGESEANLEGIISSDPGRGTTIHGLTATGKTQSRRAATALIETVGRENLLGDNCVFLTSDFTRARQTAAETILALNHLLSFEEAPFAAALPSATTLTTTTQRGTYADKDLYAGRPHPAVVINTSLRERYFGQLDQQVLMWYNKVWPVDKVDAQNVRFGVESVQQVCERVSSLVLEMEARHSGKHIVLTSHADTLQIMQMFLSGTDPRQFSSYRFKNGEVRDMERLPPPSPMMYTGVNK